MAAMHWAVPFLGDQTTALPGWREGVPLAGHMATDATHRRFAVRQDVPARPIPGFASFTGHVAEESKFLADSGSRNPGQYNSSDPYWRVLERSNGDFVPF